MFAEAQAYLARYPVAEALVWLAALGLVAFAAKLPADAPSRARVPAAA